MEPVRCQWCLGDEAMIAYHDNEWGTPVGWPESERDAAADRLQFEFLVLEGAQAGLSWRTILHRRDGYRAAYAKFDPAAVVAFGDADRQRLLADRGIVRNRAKVDASINNARLFVELQRERGSFCSYLWSFADGQPVVNRWRSMDEIPASTELSEKISSDLKKRGFRFVGPTIMYAHLQAIGVVNDHLVDCFRYSVLTQGRS